MSTAQSIRHVPGLPDHRFVNEDEIAKGLKVSRALVNESKIVASDEVTVFDRDGDTIYWSWSDGRLTMSSLGNFTGTNGMREDGIYILPLT